MKIRYSDLIFDSIVDGPSLRTVLFTQGCSHHCPGCHNMKTWSTEGGELVEVNELIEKILAQRSRALTFSGGEPFEQPAQCTLIAKELKKHQFNLWAYSGYTYEQILSDPSKLELLQHIDVLVDGRFELAKKSLTLQFKGSSNQRIIDVQKSLKHNEIVLYKLLEKTEFRRKREGIYI